MTMPTAYVVHQANATCACSELPDTVPKSRSHLFIRDFNPHAHSAWDQLGIDPVFWDQNMKNATVPTWNSIECQIRKKLFVALKDLPTQSTHGMFQYNNVIDSFIDECRSAFAAHYGNTDPRVCTDSVRSQRFAVRNNCLRAGIFDKATQSAWISCSVLAISLWVGCFLANKRK